METLLRQLNSDKQTKEALLTYLVGFFEDKIIERAMKKQSVDSLADAIAELKAGISQLDIDYGIKTKPKSPINPAR